MKGNKLKPNMTRSEIVFAFSEGNICAKACLRELTLEPLFYDYVKLLDSLEIYGDLLAALWKECCNEDVNKIVSVMQELSKMEMSKKQIHKKIKSKKLLLK